MSKTVWRTENNHEVEITKMQSYYQRNYIDLLVRVEHASVGIIAGLVTLEVSLSNGHVQKLRKSHSDFGNIAMSIEVSCHGMLRGVAPVNPIPT